MPVAIPGNDKFSIKKRFKSFDLQSPHSIRSYANKGIKVDVFLALAEALNMPEKSLAAIINLPERMINNYKEERNNLETEQAEHLLKLIALYQKGEEIFGNVEEFNYWLKKPFWKAEETPVSRLITPAGVDLLMNELDKLVHGYPV
ncbi:MAG: hypothetical protein JWQ09_1672 [Segetibacter sp.]|nr:hypothetical protein [Segetibacter sp.]